MKRTLYLTLTFLLASFALLQAEEQPQIPADLAKLESETHAASLKLREEALRRTIAKDTCFPIGTWGDNLWCLAALYLNEKTDEANARLLKRAKDYIATTPAANAPRTSPEAPGNLPWIASDGTFEKFQSAVLANDLKITADKVDYQFGPSGNHLEVTRYVPQKPDRFALPLINGKPVDLHPAATYQSPYLNGAFGSDKISVTVGPFKRIFDFSAPGE